jgi:hypothetical protein
MEQQDCGTMLMVVDLKEADSLLTASGFPDRSQIFPALAAREFTW